MQSARTKAFFVRTAGSRRPRTPEGWNALRAKALGRHALTLVWTSARRMRELNRTYRGRDAATNVLAFPLRRDYGEVFLCPELIKKEASGADIPFLRHATALFAHALLHLRGMRHRTYAAARRMEREEKKLLWWYNKTYKR